MPRYDLPEDSRGDRIIKDLQDRVERLEKGTRAGSTSIDDGSLEVRQAGTTKVKVGKLDDNSYGLALYDAFGMSLPLSQLAFGPKTKKADGIITPTRNAWALDPDMLTGPVTVTNNRMIVIISAKIVSGSGGQSTPTDAWYAWGAGGAQTILPDFNSALYCAYRPTVGQNTILQASWVDMVEGIANGVYNVQPYTYAGSLGSPANDSSFSFRRMVVLPY